MFDLQISLNTCCKISTDLVSIYCWTLLLKKGDGVQFFSTDSFPKAYRAITFVPKVQGLSEWYEISFA